MAALGRAPHGGSLPKGAAVMAPPSNRADRDGAYPSKVRGQAVQPVLHQGDDSWMILSGKWDRAPAHLGAWLRAI